MTRRYGILGKRGPRASASRLVTHRSNSSGVSSGAYGDWCYDHYCKTDESCIRLESKGVCVPKVQLTSQPPDPGWHSTGAPKINSLSSVRHMAFGGGKHQIIRGRNLQTIQRVFMKRVHASNPIVIELPIISQTSSGLELIVAVPDSSGINFDQGKRLFLTDMQPWSYEFGPGDIGASKLLSSVNPSSSSRRPGKFKRVKRSPRGLRRKIRRM